MLNWFDERALPTDRRASELVRQRSHAGARLPRQLASHLNRVFGEINAVLIAVAIGLAVLDYLFLLRWEVGAMLSR